jgi:hypothetical protein
MPKKVSVRIQDHFVQLTDPRRRKAIYPLINRLGYQRHSA